MFLNDLLTEDAAMKQEFVLKGKCSDKAHEYTVRCQAPSQCGGARVKQSPTVSTALATASH